MDELANKFSISELQSILIYLQFGSSIAHLISEIEDPNSRLLNPTCRGKFNGMLPRLRAINAEEEQILRAFSNEICGPNILNALRPLYTED